MLGVQIHVSCPLQSVHLPYRDYKSEVDDMVFKRRVRGSLDLIPSHTSKQSVDASSVSENSA